MADFPATTERVVVTRFIVSREVDRSRWFRTEVLGSAAVLEGELSIAALGTGWITIRTGGGPITDKPNVTLEPPADPDRASSFLSIRVDGHLIEARQLERRRSRALVHLTAVEPARCNA